MEGAASDVQLYVAVYLSEGGVVAIPCVVTTRTRISTSCLIIIFCATSTTIYWAVELTAIDGQ